MPPAVDDEPDRSGNIHPLEQWRLARDSAGGDEDISAKDQRSAGPAGNLDGDFDGGQAANLRST